ncbi:hypothetical protein [Panacagrimonas perspica]|uniref:hypothetical protein n=1 Tax=Panacagrimonas perspica TaxID=381431 RepID=UPI0010603285|nr:hypothetical protein [Panacagrimonas perspica]
MSRAFAAIIVVLVAFALGEWAGLGTTWSVVLGLVSGAVVARQGARHRSLEQARARWYEKSQRSSTQQVAFEAPPAGAENSVMTDPASRQSLAATLRADRVNWMWISYALIAGWAVYEVVGTSEIAQVPVVDVAVASPAPTGQGSAQPPAPVTTAAVPTVVGGGDPSVSTPLLAASDTPARELMVEASAPAPIAAPRHRAGSSRACSCSDPRCGCRRSIDRVRPDSTRGEM